MTLEACAQLVKERFSLPNVKIFGELNKMVSTAAISPGSGKSMARPALEAGVDVLISGDIDHHTGIDMADCGMVVIDAGHYGIEHIYIEDMAKISGKGAACPENLYSAHTAAVPGDLRYKQKGMTGWISR